MPNNDTDRLRDLAGQYAQIATSPVMDQRRQKWRLHNGLHERTVPFHIEDNGTFYQDLMPPLQCRDDECRGLESALLRAVFAFQAIDDDRIVPDRFVVDWVTPTTELCPELQTTRADSGAGRIRGYKTNKPIQDIDADMHKLSKRHITLERELSLKRLELARQAFDGLLPVELGRLGSYYSHGITNRAVHLMGMQELYMQMAINPEAVHRLFGFVAEDNLALGDWEQQQGLLTLNHDGNQGYCSGSCYYSDETDTASGEQVQSTDRWGYLESQESAGISAAMFDEFLMPHLTRLAGKFKLLKFGCCEAVHNLMPVLVRLPGLRKVSVSPWCDLGKLAETCPDTVIWSRKPVPLTMCGDTFDEAVLRDHLQETLDAGADHFVEFVFRDTCTLTGAMRDRVERTCALVREITGHPEGSRR